MTDPLTAKELVEKSHEYVERLGRECSKVIFEEYRNSHRKFEQSALPNEVATDITRWFQKRDKNISLNFDSFKTNPQTSQSHLKFKGRTKDADFEISATVSTFVQSFSQNQKTICFVKSLTITANKTEFIRRKT